MSAEGRRPSCAFDHVTTKHGVGEGGTKGAFRDHVRSGPQVRRGEIPTDGPDDLSGNAGRSCVVRWGGGIAPPPGRGEGLCSTCTPPSERPVSLPENGPFFAVCRRAPPLGATRPETNLVDLDVLDRKEEQFASKPRERSASKDAAAHVCGRNGTGKEVEEEEKQQHLPGEAREGGGEGGNGRHPLTEGRSTRRDRTRTVQKARLWIRSPATRNASTSSPQKVPS